MGQLIRGDYTCPRLFWRTAICFLCNAEKLLGFQTSSLSTFPIRRMSLSSQTILKNSNIKYVFLIQNWEMKVFYHHTESQHILYIFIPVVHSGLWDSDNSWECSSTIWRNTVIVYQTPELKSRLAQSAWMEANSLKCCCCSSAQILSLVKIKDCGHSGLWTSGAAWSLIFRFFFAGVQSEAAAALPNNGTK